jgi:hypothetical protein
MPYAFEDYDAFLASFGAGRLGEQLQHNPSLSTTLTTDEDDAVFSNIYPEYDQQPQGHTLLSPDYTSSSSSPHELNQLQQQECPQFTDFDFNNTTFGSAEIKQESLSSHTSSTSSPHDTGAQQSTRVKLADAVPHGGSISKRGLKKEKSSHNMIEKRYRTNINDKIKALRDSVPALRVLVDSGDDEFDDLDGLQPAKKLNKATILSKATEYIKHLESKNEVLKKENDELKNKLYGYGQITPGSSVGSLSSRSDVQESNGGLSFGNKVLLGGMACMVGTGLSDEFGSVDTKSLFALPVFGYDTTGLRVLSKPFVILLKISFVFAVLINLVFPSVFQPKKSKNFQPVETIVDDVRGLRTRSIASTLFVSSGSDNNNYVKSAIFRCLLLKMRYSQSNILVKTVVDLYIDHIWSYLKQVKIHPTGTDYENLKTILSLNNNETIHRDILISKLSNFDCFSTPQSPDELSVCAILSHMINETRTNMLLRKFTVQTLATDHSIPEIEKSLVSEIDEYNMELSTLFNPTEEKLRKYKTVLESSDVSKLKADDIFVLISGIIQNLIFEKKDYANAHRWFSKIEAIQNTNFSLLGFTALYITVLSMISCQPSCLEDKYVVLKIEEISAILRIWLGNSNGSVLNFSKRSQLIDFFVKVSLKINGLECHNDDAITLVSR